MLASEGKRRIREEAGSLEKGNAKTSFLGFSSRSSDQTGFMRKTRAAKCEAPVDAHSQPHRRVADDPKVEVFADYSYIHANPQNNNIIGTFSLNGGGGGGTFFLDKYFGIKAEF